MKKILVLITFMVFAMAGVARADYFYLDESSSNVTNVTINDPGAQNLATSAGLFSADFGPTQTTTQAYQAFCVDYANINWNTGYTTYSAIAVPDGAYNQAAWIMANYSALGYTAPEAQVAIWEVVFQQLSTGTLSPAIVNNTNPGSKFAVTGGLSDADVASADNLVTAVLANDPNGTSFNASGYEMAVSPSTTGYYGADSQDFLLAVPEPSPLIFLGVSLFGVGVAGWRFRRIQEKKPRVNPQAKRQGRTALHLCLTLP